MQAAHSEELERLQAEHARELAGLAAAAEADREHGAAVAAALRSRGEATSEPASPTSPSASSVLRGCASHRSSPDISSAAFLPSQARGRDAAPVDPMHALRPAQGIPARAGYTEAGNSLHATGAQLGTQRPTGQAEVYGGGSLDAGGAAQGRVLLAALTAMALTSALPAAPADAVCRVTHHAYSPAAGGNAASPDTNLPNHVKKTKQVGSNTAAVQPAGARELQSHIEAEHVLAEHEARVARERERGDAALAELQNRHVAELAALQQHIAADGEHDSAVQGQEERLAQKHSADLAALQRRQNLAIAELQAQLDHSAAAEPNLPQMSLGNTQEQRPEEADFIAKQEAAFEALHEQLAVQTQQHQAALAALNDRLDREHASELATLEQQHRLATSQLQEELAQAHAAELAALQGRLQLEAAQLRKQRNISLEVTNDGLKQLANDVAEQDASAMAELRATLEERHRSQLMALEEDFTARKEVELAALRNQNESALAEMQVSLKSRHIIEMAALREEVGERHKAELAALDNQHGTALLAMQADEQRRRMEVIAAVQEDLGAGHDAQLLAMLAWQFEAGVLADADALRRRSAQLAAVQQQHREALVQLREDLVNAHASELSILKEQHKQELAQTHEELAATHAAELAAQTVQQMEVLAQARKDLTAAHSAELAAVRDEDMEGFTQEQEELASAHAYDMQDLERVLEDLKEAHSDELANAYDEHDKTMALMREELENAHSAALAAAQQSHEAELRDLQQQHGEALARMHAQLAASGEHPLDVQSAQQGALRDHCETTPAETSMQNASSREMQLCASDQQQAEPPAEVPGDFLQPAGQGDVHGKLPRQQEKAGSQHSGSLEQRHRDEQALLEEDHAQVAHPCLKSCCDLLSYLDVRRLRMVLWQASFI